MSSNTSDSGACLLTTQSLPRARLAAFAGASPLCALQRVHGSPRLVAALSAVPTCKGGMDDGRTQINWLHLSLMKGRVRKKQLCRCTCAATGLPSEGREHDASSESQLTRDCVCQAIAFHLLEALSPRFEHLSVVPAHHNTAQQSPAIATSTSAIEVVSPLTCL